MSCASPGGVARPGHDGRVRFDHLDTPRLRLRPFTAADADHLVELDADPAVMHVITAGRATPRLEVRQDVLPAFLRDDVASQGYGFWAAKERLTGHVVGWFHLPPAPDTPHEARARVLASPGIVGEG